ncbi:MAG: hypothetical protein ABI780_03325 [Ardenticatenales bacterium]
MNRVPPLVRSVLAVIAGVIIGSLVVGLIEGANVLLFPPPAGMRYDDPVAMGAYMAHLPITAYAVVGLGWMLGALAGGAAAARVAGRKMAVHGLLVGVILAVASVMNLVDPSLPAHPVWMWAMALLAAPMGWLGGWLGAWLVARRMRTDV